MIRGSKVHTSRQGTAVPGVVVLGEKASIYCGRESVVCRVSTILAGGVSVSPRPVILFVFVLVPRGFRVGCHVTLPRLPVTTVRLLIALVCVGTDAASIIKPLRPARLPRLDLGLPRTDLGLPRTDLGLPRTDLGLPRIERAFLVVSPALALAVDDGAVSLVA